MKKLALYVFVVLMVCNTAQALPECEGEDDTQWTNCQGTYLKKETGPGWTRDYTGEFGSVPGKRHGKGSSKVYKDGSLYLTYVGEFKDNKPNGQGTFTYASVEFAGSKYVGEFEDGKMHGQGIFTFAIGHKYVGEIKDGKKHGQGTWTFDSGEKYVGEYKDGQPNGQGISTFVNGDKYVGEFKNGKPHGQGTFTYTSGEKYVGEFKNGKPHGQGTWTYEDGRVEKGILKKDKLIKFATVSKMMPISKGFDFICYNSCKERNDETFCRQKCSIQ
jgi:hypothetical protein